MSNPGRGRGRRLDPVEAIWMAVVVQALTDAKAIGKHADGDREEAREWLRGCPERDQALIAVEIDPDAFDRRLPALEELWREIDEKIARLRAEGHRSGRWVKPGASSGPSASP